MKVSKVLAAITLALTSISFNSSAELVDSAQNWKTFETENFRVHFTPEYRQWALSSAREMENVRSLIQKQQGRIITEKVDAYIVDPYNAANGFAFPLSHRPYMAFFATPPQSDSIIANSTGWQQLLVLHEYVHLVHLAQKNRSNWRNNLADWYDLFDASQINEERWVSEGYATLLESKLTGRGRLYNNQVEAIIQQFARQGALPTYQELNSASDKFMSGSMAYLVGVRYLKWLEENYGEDTLDAVWTRWHAIEQRDFEKAFVGVFPDTAQNLYQRFVAEYTFNAMQHEAQLTAKTSAEQNSKIWLDLSGPISGPSLSPNGEYIAVVETNRKGNSNKTKLQIYKTTENSKSAEKFAKNNEEILAADPLDIADKAPTVFKREVTYYLNQKNNRGIKNPRWLDNETIIYGASSRAGKNEFHQDIFSWHLPSNTVKQLTTNANLRRFDISNDGRYLVAERSRFGYSQLVKVSLATESLGEVITELTEKSLADVYDFPRVRPITAESSSNSIAYVSSSLNNKWQLKVRQLDSSQEEIIPLPADYQFLSFPEWSKDGMSLFYVAGLDSAIRLYKYDFSDKSLSVITSGDQVVSWPMVKSNDQLLHLAINAQGPDIYQLDVSNNKQLVAQTTISSAMTTNLAESLRIDKATIKVDKSIGEETGYGIGPQQGTITLAESYYSASSSIFEFGYKSGDVLSRFDWQINASQDVFSNILSGASATIRWQGWPVKILGHGYQFNLKTEQQYSDALAFDKITEQGLLVEARYPYSLEEFSIDFFAQFQAAKFESNKINESFTNQSVSLGVEQSWSYDQQSWGISQAINVQLISAQDDLVKLNGSDGNYSGSNGSLNLVAHIHGYGLGFNYLWAERSEEAGNILSLGGYTSTLIQEKAHLNKQLAPELAFYRQAGNEYHAYQAYIPFGFIEAFYTRHEMSQQPIIDSYGVKGSLTNDFGFTGFTNLAINYGLAQVNPENESSETQGWLGFSYKW